MKVWGFLRPAAPALVIALGVYLICVFIWREGWFQEPELFVYDHLVQWRVNPEATDSRIMLVELTEHDIDTMDYPLTDKVMSEVLEKMEAGGAAVIGVDFYRDLPEPRNGSEIAALNKTLQQHENIICIFLYNTKKDPFTIPPPPVLAGNYGQITFNNFPNAKVIRRAYLTLPGGKDAQNNQIEFQSFAWLLAQYYFYLHSIQAGQSGDSFRLGKTDIPNLKADDGGYINETTGGCAFMQDFRGPPTESSIDTLSVSEVRALKDPSIFKDKIVLLGIKAFSNNDTFHTPISAMHLDPPKVNRKILQLADEQEASGPGSTKEKKKLLQSTDENEGRVPGVFIHAQIVNQLLRIAIDGDKPTGSRSQVFGWVWMAVCCAVGVVSGFYIRSHVAFACAVGGGLGSITLFVWMQFLAGYWIIAFGPATVFLGTAMLAKAYAATHEGMERKNLMKLFSQHATPEVAEQMWEQREVFLEGGRPPAQELMVTALFTDLKNYSTISEKMTPNELISWINECQGALAQHVIKNHGHINCYMGDGMMAVFGVPIPHHTVEEQKQDAINAVTCALGMAGEIKRMNAEWRAQGKPLAGLRVGIYTGKAMTGVLGVENKLAYSVIGDTVNTASRLESVDKEGQMTKGDRECRILIGKLTYEFTCDRFPAQLVGSVTLKGKAEITQVYNVLDSDGEPEQTT